MIQTRLTELLGTKHPIIQAGMGPFSNNNLCVAAANAGALGLLSTSGLFNKEAEPWIYQDFTKTAEAAMDDDMGTALEKVLKRTYRLVKDHGGVFGINVMVSAELTAISGQRKKASARQQRRLFSLNDQNNSSLSRKRYMLLRAEN
jgi:NAD(P)H-dependent flavin oxidoreductase YrpB (nitropropane dioxygenase family)